MALLQIREDKAVINNSKEWNQVTIDGVNLEEIISESLPSDMKSNKDYIADIYITIGVYGIGNNGPEIETDYEIPKVEE